jgi:hypothetical protein
VRSASAGGDHVQSGWLVGRVARCIVPSQNSVMSTSTGLLPVS